MIYYFQIKINKNIGSGTLFNSVCLFSDECTTIPATFWDHVVDPNGLDIRFYDSDWTTELKREIVLFDVSGHKVEAHVQISARDVSVDKLIWCHYGEAVVANSTDIWTDIAAVSIWKLNGNGNDALGRNDASAVGNPVSVIGKFGGGFLFDGGDYFNAGYGASLYLTTNGTVSAWIKISASGGGGVIVSKQAFSSYRRGGYSLYVENSVLKMAIGDSNGSQIATGLTNLADGHWHYVVGTWDVDWIRVYVDGVLDGPAELNTELSEPEALPLYIGRGYYDLNFDFVGIINEVRVFSGTLSYAMIASEYANQNDPDTFLTCGLEHAGMIYADYSFAPAGGINQQLFVFTNASDSVHGITSHLWNFGDGTGSSEENPSKLFGPGRHSITLTVTGPDGTASISKDVIVYGADLSYVPDSGPVPLSVRFNSELTLP